MKWRDRLWNNTNNLEFYKKARDVKPSDVIIDIGAYTGDFEYYMNNHAKVIYAIEPHIPSFKKLIKNIKKYKLDRVEPFNFAIWKRDGVAYLRGGSMIGGHNIYDYEEGGTTAVPIFTLKTFMVTHGIDHIDILKIEVNGNEYEILDSISDCVDKINLIIMKDHRKNCKELFEKYGYDFGFNPEMDLIEWGVKKC